MNLVTDGYRDAGYVSLHIDDCWMANERDEVGNLVANSSRFPSGIPALADYVCSELLKQEAVPQQGSPFWNVRGLWDEDLRGIPGQLRISSGASFPLTVV